MGWDNWRSMEITQWKSILLYPYLLLSLSRRLSLCFSVYTCVLLWTPSLIPWRRAGVAPALVLDCCEEEKEEGAEVCRLKGSWMGWLTPRAAYSITVAHNDVWCDTMSHGLDAASTCAAPIIQPSKKAQSHHVDLTQPGLNGANPWTLLVQAVLVDTPRASNKEKWRFCLFLKFKL